MSSFPSGQWQTEQILKAQKICISMNLAHTSLSEMDSVGLSTFSVSSHTVILYVLFHQKRRLDSLAMFSDQSWQAVGTTIGAISLRILLFCLYVCSFAFSQPLNAVMSSVTKEKCFFFNRFMTAIIRVNNNSSSNCEDEGKKEKRQFILYWN